MTAGFLMPVAAVLFDCDGVLVDSDASVLSAWGRWAVKYGLDPVAVGEMVHGRRAADTVALLIPSRLQAEALADINAFEVEDAVAVVAIPGAAELLNSPGLPCAVVTSGTRVLATARLAAAGLVAPDIVITADDVVQGKPAPEGYLAAASRLGVPAGEAVVVEDAVSGAQAARAAGVRFVLGVGARALDTDADAVVADLRSVRWTGTGLLLSVDGLLRAPDWEPV